MELFFVELDSNNFIIGIGTQYTDNSIGMYLDPHSDFLLNFRKYRYDKENNEIIYDESNVIEECKDGLKIDIELLSNGDDTFEVEISSGKFLFKYSHELRECLSTNNSLVSLGLTELLLIPCFDENGNKLDIYANTDDFVKIMKEMVYFVNRRKELIAKRKAHVDTLTSIKELNDYKKEIGING